LLPFVRGRCEPIEIAEYGSGWHASTHPLL
jgi:hypothetical protein